MKFSRPVALVLALGIAALGIVAACNSGNNNSVVNPPVRELDSGTLGLNGVYAHTFANAGTFGYHCTIHGLSMAGSVTVAAGQPASAAVTIGPSNNYNPPSVQVAPGGTVTWTNSPTGSAHTVTSN